MKLLCANQLVRLSAILVTVAACSVAQTNVAKAQTADDPVVVAAISKIARDVSIDGNGVVTQIDFRGTDIGNDDLEQLKKLKKLGSLLLNDTQVNDDGLKTVGEIITLRNLDLRGCRISNAGISHLTGLKILVALKLTGKGSLCSVDDDAMDDIAKLTTLRAIALDSLWVSGDGLAKLKPLTILEELYIGSDDNLMDDASMEVIANNFPKLKKLRISKSTVSAEGLAHLAKLTKLEQLDLSECSQVFDDGLVHLAKLTELNRLNLWRLGVTDEGIAQLAGLTKMKWLNLDNTRITNSGMAHLAGMKQMENLYLGSTGITDESLVNLEGMSALKELKVQRTAITKAGAEKLKAKLPKVDIQLVYTG